MQNLEEISGAWFKIMAEIFFPKWNFLLGKQEGILIRNNNMNLPEEDGGKSQSFDLGVHTEVSEQEGKVA